MPPKVTTKKKVNRGMGRPRMGAKEAEMRLYERNLRQGAESRFISVELTTKQIREIASKPCTYCGELHQGKRAKSQSYRSIKGDISDKQRNNIEEYYSTDPWFYSGVDRRDNNVGYTIDNCIPCCGSCNFLKRQFPEEHFLGQIKKIYEHYMVNNNIIASEDTNE